MKYALRPQPKEAEKPKETMLGSMVPSFICRKCKQPKLVYGRQKVFNGWKCADCIGAEKETKEACA